MKKKISIILIVVVAFLSCSKDSDDASNTTQAIITIKSQSGEPLQNVMVFLHAYKEGDIAGRYSSSTEVGSFRSDEKGTVYCLLENSPDFYNPNEELFTAENNYNMTFGFNAAFRSGGWKQVEVEFKRGEVKEFEMWSN